MTEIDKYRAIYSRPADYPHYGHSNHGKGMLPHVVAMAPNSVIDIGCGYNEFITALSAQLPKHTRLVGVDFACPGADVISPATNLPFPDRSFDLLTSFDMLEHLLPEEVPAALAEFARVSNRFAFAICHRASLTLVDGHNLHPTVQPESWWLEQIRKAGATSIHKIGHYICGHWRTTPAPAYIAEIASPSFAALANSRQGQHAYIFGAGPSLDDWLQQQPPLPPGTFTIGINDVGRTRPCDLNVSVHVFPRFAQIPGIWFNGLNHCYTQSMHASVWRTPSHASYGFVTNFVNDASLSRDHIATYRWLWAKTSSAQPAVHLAWYLGAQAITFVGLDGGRSTSQQLRATGWTSTSDYSIARQDTEQLATHLFSTRWQHWAKP